MATASLRPSASVFHLDMLLTYLTRKFHMTQVLLMVGSGTVSYNSKVRLRDGSGAAGTLSMSLSKLTHFSRFV